MADYTVGIRITGRLESSLKNALKEAQHGITGLNLAGKAGGALLKASAGLINGAAAGLGAFGAYAIKTGMEYEQAIGAAAATAGASSEEFARMSDAAKRMGATTSMTAAESANALEYMALAGWDVDTSISALPHVLHLAEASGMDLARTSDLVTDSMSAAGFAVDDLGHYLDVMTVAQTRSNQTSEQLMEAMIGVGGQLRNLGVPMETSATMLGLLANAGIKGTEGATALNAVLANMVKRSGDAGKAMDALNLSLFDANGNTRDMRDVFGDLSVALAGCTEEQRASYLAMLGGKQHVDAMNALLTGLNDTNAEGVLLWDDLAASIGNADGAMQRFYDQKTDNLQFNVKLLTSAFSNLALSVYESDLLAPANDYVKWAIAAINDIQQAFTTNGLDGALAMFGELVPLGVNKILQDAPQFLEAAIVCVENLLAGFERHAGMIGDSAGALIDKYAEGIVRVAPRLLVVGAHLLAAVARGIIEHLPELKDAAVEAVTYLGTELRSGISSMWQNVTSGDTSIGERLASVLPAVLGGIVGFSAIGGAISKLRQFTSVFSNCGKTGVKFSNRFGKNGILGALFGKGGGLNIAATLKTVGSVGIIVGAITGVSTLLGWLGNNVDGFKQNLAAGAEIAGAIGEFIGNFVGGAIGGLAGTAADVFTRHLPMIADSLSSFAQHMTPFVDTVSTFDTSKMSAFAVSLGQMLLAMAGNDLLMGLERFLGIQDGLETFAAKLSGFVDSIGPAFDKLGAVNQAGVDNAPKVFGSLSAISAIQFNSGGLLQAIIGELDLANVGTQIGAFADSAGPAFDKMASINEAGIEKTPQVFEGLSRIGNYEFRSGGLAQLFSGDVDLAGIGSQMGAFASSAGPAFDKMAAISEAGIEKTPQVFEGLSRIGNYEFRSGGLAQFFSGDVDLAGIGGKLREFAATAGPAFSSIASFPMAGIEKAPQIFEALSKLSGYEFKAGGLAQLFTGSTGSGIADIGKGLQQFVDAISPALTKFGAIDAGSINKILRLFNTLSEVGSAVSGGQLSALSNVGSLQTISSQLDSFISRLAPVLQRVQGIDVGVFAKLRQMFSSLQGISDIVASANLSNGSLQSFGQELVSFVDSFSQVSAKLGAMDTAGTAGLDSFIGSLSQLSAGLVSVSGEIGGAVSSITGQLDTLSGSVAAAGAAVQGFTEAGSAVSGTMQEMTSSVSDGASSMTSTMTQAMTDINSTVTSGMAALPPVATAQMANFTSAIQAGGANAVSAARTTVSNIRSVFSGIDLSSAGRNMMAGLVRGINSQRGSVLSAARSIAQAAADTMNAVLKVKSPSRVTMATGRFVTQGLAVGMRQEVPAAMDAAQRAASGIAAAVAAGADLKNTAVQMPQWDISLPDLRPLWQLWTASGETPQITAPMARLGTAQLSEQEHAIEPAGVQRLRAVTQLSPDEDEEPAGLTRYRDLTRQLQQDRAEPVSAPADQEPPQVTINYSPTIQVTGGSDTAAAVQQVLKTDKRTFRKQMEEYLRDERRLRFR